MSILVTGGAGYIGSHTVVELLEENGIAYELSELNIELDDGHGNFTIDKIPVGKNRVVTVKALNKSKIAIIP